MAERAKRYPPTMVAVMSLLELRGSLLGDF